MPEEEIRFTFDTESTTTKVPNKLRGGGGWITCFVQRATEFLQREARKPFSEVNARFAEMINEIKRGERDRMLPSDHPPGFTNFPDGYSERL